MIDTKRAIFLTLTFSNDVLNKTNKATRQRYIKEYLKSETALYIANIDYGKKKGREHYHALIITNTLEDVKPKYKSVKDKINLKAYKYGEINADFVISRYKISTEEGREKIARKLTAHFIKESTKREKIIFSRKAPTEEEQIRRLESKYKIELNQKRENEKIINEITEELDEIYKNANTDFLDVEYIKEMTLNEIDKITHNKITN